jgi:hypothetical protein
MTLGHFTKGISFGQVFQEKHNRNTNNKAALLDGPLLAVVS